MARLGVNLAQPGRLARLRQIQLSIRAAARIQSPPKVGAALRYKHIGLMFGLAMSGCSNASPSPAANNVAENVQQASDEKAIPSNYPGAPEAIAIGIGKHEGQFFRTIVQNDAVTYMSLVNRDARNGTALAWDVTVLRDISQPLSVKMYVGLWHYDCRKRTSVWVHSMSINDQWKVVESSTPYFQDVANVEGSGGDEQTKFACGEKNRAKPVKDLLNDANRFFAIDE